MKHVLRALVTSMAGTLPEPLLRELASTHQRKMLARDPFIEQQGLVGTFHKTGTVLIAGIFREICRVSGTTFWNASDYKDESEPTSWNVCFDGHSDFGKLEKAAVAQLPKAIIVRDPRDVVISAAYYHTKSKEPWLHVAKDEFDGKTYQQVITELPTAYDRFKFELEHSAAYNINKMLSWAESQDPKLLILHLEDLTSDKSLAAYHKLFDHLGMGSAFHNLGHSVAFKRSLFSEEKQRTAHVRDPHPAQWKTEFNDEVLNMFHEKFKNAPEILGYESSF